VALPKKRHSKTRGLKRRTHWIVKAQALAVCPQCKQMKVPHNVCTVCGFYDGRQVIEIKVKEKKKKRQ
jgi:large subunit ribosomal protein L32